MAQQPGATPAQRRLIIVLYGKSSADGIAEAFGLSRSHIFKIWKEAGVSEGFARGPEVHIEKRSLPSLERPFFASIEPLEDGRNLTARLLGDPLPGRSALDQRGAI